MLHSFRLSLRRIRKSEVLMAQIVPGSPKKYLNGQFMKNMDGGIKMNSLKGVWR
jgi:hypothetical protein